MMTKLDAVRDACGNGPKTFAGYASIIVVCYIYHRNNIILYCNGRELAYFMQTAMEGPKTIYIYIVKRTRSVQSTLRGVEGELIADNFSTRDNRISAHLVLHTQKLRIVSFLST